MIDDYRWKAADTVMRKSMAALQALRKRLPWKLVLAVPVAPPDAVADLRSYVDELVCLAQPQPFNAIGVFYSDFHQLSDAEVIGLLRSADAGIGT